MCIPASAADAAAVNPKRFNTLLANGLITFDIKGNPVFSNGPNNLPKNPPDCIILDNWVFDNLILTDESFEKALRILEICLSVNNSSCEKLASSLESPIILGDNTTSFSFFIADFNLFNCEFDNFTFSLLY